MSGWGPRVFPSGGGSGGGGGGGGGDPEISDSTLNIYSEVSSVPAGPEATVLSYTTVGTTVTQLIRAEFGGTNIGRYRLRIDGVMQAQYVTWFNGPMDGTWVFDAISLNPGQIITIKVEHGRPFDGDYWARLSVIRIDA